MMQPYRLDMRCHVVRVEWGRPRGQLPTQAPESRNLRFGQDPGFSPNRVAPDDHARLSFVKCVACQNYEDHGRRTKRAAARPGRMHAGKMRTTTPAPLRQLALQRGVAAPRFETNQQCRSHDQPRQRTRHRPAIRPVRSLGLTVPAGSPRDRATSPA